MDSVFLFEREAGRQRPEPPPSSGEGGPAGPAVVCLRDAVGELEGAPADGAVRVVDEVLEFLDPVLSDVRVGEQLHTVLKDYKRSPDERVRERHRYQVAAILHRFLRDHTGCIEAAVGTTWDTVTIVPSKTPGADPHPLEQAIKLGKKPKATYQPLLAPDQPETIDRVYGDDRAFRTIKDVTGKQVLLIDDTFTSGATFQSAASRLALDGATVIAGLAIGRVITTGDPRHPANDAFWERQRAIAFSFDRCCLEP